MYSTHSIVWEAFDETTPRSVREVCAKLSLPQEVVVKTIRELCGNGGIGLVDPDERDQMNNTYRRKPKRAFPKNRPPSDPDGDENP